MELAIPGIKVNGALGDMYRHEVATLLKRDSLTFPGAQPISFARLHLDELQRRE